VFAYASSKESFDRPQKKERDAAKKWLKFGKKAALIETAM